ncbi:MAG: orotate phosphoribosyltransferase [Clostridiales Family XIII bacterium]|jgi:orotate phosphoribosyltransferase|nr:orotate phosphoribosyltransferase [Clostridiales Family XIII bacterium]
MSYQLDFIETMVRAGVLKFGNFVTKSGRQSPYFINTGEFKTGAQIGKLGEFYAACIADKIEKGELAKDIDVIFGPAYKGIPLAVSTAIALARDYGINAGYCFNRKETKDHGEGGNLVGAKLKDGDKVIVIDDVITAGTAIREAIPIITGTANVEIAGLVISVDRMERGQGAVSAVEEVRRDLGIKVFPIVTVQDILSELDGREIDGALILTAECKASLIQYMAKYC